MIIPYWPAAMDQKTAAAYCGVCVETFKDVCPVKPVQFTASSRGDRYLRAKLDEWLMSLDPNGQTQGAPKRKFGDRIYGQGQAGRA